MIKIKNILASARKVMLGVFLFFTYIIVLGTTALFCRLFKRSLFREPPNSGTFWKKALFTGGGKEDLLSQS